MDIMASVLFEGAGARRREVKSNNKAAILELNDIIKDGLDYKSFSIESQSSYVKAVFSELFSLVHLLVTDPRFLSQLSIISLANIISFRKRSNFNFR